MSGGVSSSLMTILQQVTWPQTGYTLKLIFLLQLSDLLVESFKVCRVSDP